MWAATALMAVSSLVVVAPCGLPLTLGCRRLWRLGYLPALRLVGRRRAGRAYRGGVGVRWAARSGGDRHLCGDIEPSRVGHLVVAGA